MRFPNSLLPSALRDPGVSAVGTWGVRHLQVGNRGVFPGQSGWYTGAAAGEFGASSAGRALVLADWLWVWLLWCVSLAGDQGLSGDGAAIPSSSEESAFPHVCSRTNRIRTEGGSPMRFQPHPVSEHCKVVPFLVTDLCSPGKSVLRYLCQVTACTGPLC